MTHLDDSFPIRRSINSIDSRKLDCQVRRRTSILENCLKKRVCKLWNSYHAKHPDSTSKYNYKTVKVKFKEYFYELFLEDRDTKHYEKLGWKEFRFNSNP